MNSRLLRILFAVVNAGGFPGVGTILAGRIKTGWIQIGLSFSFLLATLIPLGTMIVGMVSRGMTFNRITDIFLMRDTWIFSQREITLLIFAIAAAFAYFANLLWSLTTTRPLEKSGPPTLPPPIP